ncbi:MAG: hypothetical protein GVY19_12700 [Bacteroidetes bacterium]|jgi:hypothetical protein|nr:hypothetical protein [Bacteroidota bacterium]
MIIPAKLHTILILLFATAGLQAQQLAEMDRQQVWYESFTNNADEWVGIGVDDAQGSARITDEMLVEISANPGNTMVIANEIQIDTDKNFSISIDLAIKQFDASSQNSLISLSWGCNFENMHQFSFGFTPSGFGMVRNISDNLQELIAPGQMDVITTNGKNRLRIVKTNDQYQFFINDQLLGSTGFLPFYGNGLVITVGGGLHVQVDNLSIDYLIPAMDIKRLPRIVLDPPFNNKDKMETEESQYTISGYAMDEDGIETIHINGANVKHKNGRFSYQTPLALGSNLIKLEIADRSNQQKIKYLEVIRYEAPEKLIVGEKRLALVIGNAEYQHASTLRNTTNDANDMAVLLRDLNFDVMQHTDLDYPGFLKVLKEFGSKLHQYDVTLVFYAGHGIQVDQQNYLIPIDARLNSKNDVAFETVEVDKIMDMMATTDDDNLNLVILDACRNNPFRSWTRGGAEGLASIQPPSGILVAYSTSPGSYASDGLDDNGLYTQELMRQLKVSQRIEDVFINTRIAVENRSNGTQSPWELARLRGKYYLK